MQHCPRRCARFLLLELGLSFCCPNRVIPCDALHQAVHPTKYLLLSTDSLPPTTLVTSPSITVIHKITPLIPPQDWLFKLFRAIGFACFSVLVAVLSALLFSSLYFPGLHHHLYSILQMLVFRGTQKCACHFRKRRFPSLPTKLAPLQIPVKVFLWMSHLNPISNIAGQPNYLHCLISHVLRILMLPLFSILFVGDFFVPWSYATREPAKM